jgi:serine/threonine protein kinase
MDSHQVIARFEAERQALGMMDHPNIAKVLDGGTTQESRPYFVMEFVKGKPITEYCDQHRLNTRDRLQLFIYVCQTSPAAAGTAEQIVLSAECPVASEFKPGRSA